MAKKTKKVDKSADGRKVLGRLEYTKRFFKILAEGDAGIPTYKLIEDLMPSSSRRKDDESEREHRERISKGDYDNYRRYCKEENYFCRNLINLKFVSTKKMRGNKKIVYYFIDYEGILWHILRLHFGAGSLGTLIGLNTLVPNYWWGNSTFDEICRSKRLHKILRDYLEQVKKSFELALYGSMYALENTDLFKEILKERKEKTLKERKAEAYKETIKRIKAKPFEETLKKREAQGYHFEGFTLRNIMVGFALGISTEVLNNHYLFRLKKEYDTPEIAIFFSQCFHHHDSLIAYTRGRTPLPDINFDNILSKYIIVPSNKPYLPFEEKYFKK